MRRARKQPETEGDAGEALAAIIIFVVLAWLAGRLERNR